MEPNWGKGTGVSFLGEASLFVFCFLAGFSAGGVFWVMSPKAEEKETEGALVGTGTGVVIAGIVETEPSSPSSSLCLRFFIELLLGVLLADAVSAAARVATVLFTGGAGTPRGV